MQTPKVEGVRVTLNKFTKRPIKYYWLDYTLLDGTKGTYSLGSSKNRTIKQVEDDATEVLARIEQGLNIDGKIVFHPRTTCLSDDHPTVADYKERMNNSKKVS